MANATTKTDLSPHYTDLNKACINQDYDKVLKLSNKILQEDAKEFEAYQCKIVSLIHLDKHEDCLHHIRKSLDFGKKMVFEKAYCEYRLNRIKEAVSTLESVEQHDLRMQELYVQVLYRLERFDEAYTKYRSIIKESQDDYGQERLTNMSAVVAALSTWSDSKIDPLNVPEETYELKYNIACYLIGRRQFDEAITKLNEAEELLRDSFADDPDVTEDEINDELAPIKAQMAYTLHMQGKIEKANQIYQTIVKQRPNDAAVLAVVSANIVCVNKDQNVFESRKRIKAAMADGLKHKLMEGQKKIIATNNSLFCFHTNQAESCRSTSFQQSEENSANERPALIYVCQLVKEKQVQKAISFLETYIKTRPTCMLALLTLCQLHLSLNNLSACTQVMESLPQDILHRPGIVATRTALYLAQNDSKAAENCLQQAVQVHKNNTAPGEEVVYIRLLNASAGFHLRRGNAQKASVLLEELRKLNPNDQRVLARLIHAYSQFDKSKAEKASKSLKQTDTQFAENEVDSLESAFLFGAKYVKRMVKGGPDSTPKPASGKAKDFGQLKRTSKSKKRKPKLPQNCDPNAVLDPERWLPRRERSYYRGRKKDKRTANMMRGPQGQTTGSGDLDQSSRAVAGSDPSSPRTDSGKSKASGATTSSTPSAGGGSRQQQKNKKKKGNRW